MAKMKLKELRGADVRFISLVDRAATRIPFRVLKRDKENQMGIDLTTVFKSDTGVKPHVAALVVFAQKSDAKNAEIRTAIGTHGFSMEKVQKSDKGETLIYAQSDEKGETHVVRLSDQLLMSVGGLTVPKGWVGEMIAENGFFPDLKLANAALYDQLVEVAKSDTPQAEAIDVLTSYAEYLNQMLVLPASAYTLNEVVQKCACGEVKTEATKDEAKADEKTVKADGKKTDDKTVKNETEEERKKRIKNHPPAEMAPADEEDDQKPPPEEVGKSDNTEILTLLKGVTEQLTSLSTKVESVVTEQADQKKVLDGVVQKADTLNETLKATVTAVPTSEDRPAHASMRVVKADDDPRRGNFDTAFIRKRNR